jgi:hypothetical protein
MVLDFDPEAVAFSSQPFQLLFGAPGDRALRHIPDFFARRRDGSAVVIDVRADDQIEPKDAAVFAATEGLCASAGWAYRRVGELDPVFAANLRWLAGYRHPRCLRSDVAARICEVFGAPAALLPGAQAAGDPVAVLPVLFHLLWSHVLATDLAGSRLSASSVVVVAGGES